MELAQIYVNVSISEGNIPLCDINQEANCFDITTYAIIQMISISYFIKPVAALVSNLKYKNIIYFFNQICQDTLLKLDNIIILPTIPNFFLLYQQY